MSRRARAPYMRTSNAQDDQGSARCKDYTNGVHPEEKAVMIQQQRDGKELRRRNWTKKPSAGHRRVPEDDAGSGYDKPFCAFDVVIFGEGEGEGDGHPSRERGAANGEEGRGRCRPKGMGEEDEVSKDRAKPKEEGSDVDECGCK